MTPGAESRDPGRWVARRVGEGFSERLGFQSPGQPDLFCRVLAPNSPKGVVVVCPTLSAARPDWANREALLSLGLARRGLLTVSFDYRGDGHSPMDESRSVGMLSEDVAAALDLADEVAGGRPISVVGIGIGGLVAVGEVGRRGLPMALWDPPGSGYTFLVGLIRDRVVRQMGFGPGGDTLLLDRVAVDLFAEELERHSLADLGGFAIERELYDGLIGLVPDDTFVRFRRDEAIEVIVSWVEKAVSST